MMLVDSSVWIDYFRALSTPQTEKLNTLLTSKRLATGDLILVEVLQGTRNQRTFDMVQQILTSLEYIRICDRQEIAIASARNYQSLRARGTTVRRTIDCLIATRCILDGIPLLYSDRDFDPFVQHLGLRSAMKAFD